MKKMLLLLSVCVLFCACEKDREIEITESGLVGEWMETETRNSQGEIMDFYPKCFQFEKDGTGFCWSSGYPYYKFDITWKLVMPGALVVVKEATPESDGVVDMDFTIKRLTSNEFIAYYSWASYTSTFKRQK